MKKEHMIERQGKQFVLYEGLLDEAHQQGLHRISTTIVQIPTDDNGKVAIVVAEVETAKGIFSGVGDASPGNVNRMIAPHLIRMAECAPLRARALTPSGWRYYDELLIGEPVAAYDTSADQVEWTPLIDKQAFSSQPTVRLHGRSFDVTCTPNHRWATKRGLRSLDTFGAGERIIVAAPAVGGHLDVTSSEAAIMGWLATDGTVRESMVGEHGPYTRAVIRQSKPRYVDELSRLTAGVAYHTEDEARERDFGAHISECLPQHSFNLTTTFMKALFSKMGFSSFADLPEIVCNLPREARTAMLDAMLKGDGTCNERGRWVFGKKRKPGVMEAFEILATLEGHALGILQTSSVGDVPLRTLRHNRHISAAYLKREDAGVQDVWCPTTVFGTWIMRLDGTISISGNTRAKARALRDAVNVGATALEELGDLDNDGDDDSGGFEQERWSNEEARTGRAIPKASPNKPASANQLATIYKLSKLLGRPEEPDENWSSADASERITELSREYNEQKGSAGRRNV